MVSNDQDDLLPFCSCGRGRIMTIPRPVSSRFKGSERYITCLECVLEARNGSNFGLNFEKKEFLHLQVLSLEVYAYFDSRYLDHWINHFSLAPSKKAVWELLRKHEIVHCSLSFFYDAVKKTSLEMFLKDTASLSAMDKILNVLDLYDPYLEERLREIMSMKKRHFLYHGDCRRSEEVFQ